MCVCAAVGHLLPTGVAARKMAFEHSFELQDGRKVIMGKSNAKKDKAIKKKEHPVMTIIHYYDEKAETFKE